MLDLLKGKKNKMSQNSLKQWDTNIKQQSWNWSVALNVDHAEDIRKVAFPGSNKKQPARKQNKAYFLMT